MSAIGAAGGHCGAAVVMVMARMVVSCSCEGSGLGTNGMGAVGLARLPVEMEATTSAPVAVSRSLRLEGLGPNGECSARVVESADWLKPAKGGVIIRMCLRRARPWRRARRHRAAQSLGRWSRRVR